MAKTPWALLASVFCLAGCGHDDGGPSASGGPGNPASAAPPALRLIGSSGSVGVGDSVEAAKKAFPAPTGARVFDHSLSFSIATKEGWGWGTANGTESFEVATRNGKIVDMAWTRATASDKPDATLGEPTREATGNSVDAFVWESGDSARFWVHVKNKAFVLPIGEITLIGSKADLNLLNYRPDDPGTFVKQMDAMSSQHGDPEIRKEMEKAKKKALDRQLH